jgi:hypothetical protein
MRYNLFFGFLLINLFNLINFSESTFSVFKYNSQNFRRRMNFDMTGSEHIFDITGSEGSEGNN